MLSIILDCRIISSNSIVEKEQNLSNEGEGLTCEGWEEDSDQAEEEVRGAHFDFLRVF
jgi:hypothetical protein